MSNHLAIADALRRSIAALPVQDTASIRGVRQAASRQLRSCSGAEVLDVAIALLETHRWVAYELVHHHPQASEELDPASVTRLGEGIGTWQDVDTFGRYVAGPAWQRRQIPDQLVRSWTGSHDRWWRRAALVATVPLNLRAAGGTGDTGRTLDICTRLVDDRDDMVVKALSWALRELVVWDADAVSRFLETHGDRLPSRVRREVRNKLDTGLKQPRRRSRAT